MLRLVKIGRFHSMAVPFTDGAGSPDGSADTYPAMHTKDYNFTHMSVRPIGTATYPRRQDFTYQRLISGAAHSR